MFDPVFARRSILIGILVSVLGIILNFQLDRIADLRVNFMVLNTAAILSISMTLIGLFSVLVGVAAWAWRAPLFYSIFAGLSVGALAFFVAEFVNINVHGPTALFTFVDLAGMLGCVLILSVAAIRFVLSRRRQHQH
jgi:hypothetical protein